MTEDFKCVQFSGGRTSAYMLHELLQEGHLTKDDLVSFQNTGKEKEETLEFIEECSVRWKVPIVWLEYDDYFDEIEYLNIYSGEIDRKRNRQGVRFKVVDYKTASRNGEPFDKLLKRVADYREFMKEAAPLLPNPVQRFCTGNMKRDVGRAYMKSMGMSSWSSYIGIRADEESRYYKMRFSCPEYETVICPLVENGTTREKVMRFWKDSLFDLRLSLDGSQGNCDLCFLKGTGKLINIMEADRSLEKWWIEKEAAAGMTFDRYKPSYQQLAQWIDEKSPKLDKYRGLQEQTIACFCGE